MSTLLAEANREYLQFLHQLHHGDLARDFIAAADKPIRIGKYELFSYGGRYKCLASDLDDSLNAEGAPCYTDNLFEALPEYNPKINCQKIKDTEKEIKQKKITVEQQAAKIFGEMAGKLHIDQADNASLDAVRMTIPVPDAYSGYQELKLRRWNEGIVSAAISQLVDYASIIKLGNPTILNWGTFLEYHPKTGIFTGRFSFNYEKNKPTSFKKMLGHLNHNIGKLSAKEKLLSAGLSDEHVSEAYFAASVDGLFVWVDTNSERMEMYRQGTLQYPGNLVIVRPEIRTKSFKILVRELLAHERVVAVYSYIAPPTYFWILQKLFELKQQEEKMLQANEIQFRQMRTSFSNDLAEILSVDSLPYPFSRINFQDKVGKLKFASDLKNMKDALIDIVSDLDTYLIEHRIEQKRLVKAEEISRKWKTAIADV